MVHVESQNVLVDVFHHRQVLFAINFQFQNGVQAVVTQHGLQFQQWNREVDWLGVGAVENTRYSPLATQTTCGALTEFVTWLCCKNWGLFSHNG